MHQSSDINGMSSNVELEELPLGEQFVLWGARLWVKSQHFAPALHLNLRDGFRAAHIEEGYLVLDRIMTLLSTQASQDIFFHCTNCNGITDHEQLVLGVIAELQTGGEGKAHRILSDWLPSATAHVAGREFNEFAILLKENGLHIRERQWFSIGNGSSRALISLLPTVH